MISGLALLLIAQLLGEVIADLFDLPIPGQVVGMVLLLVILILASRKGRDACAMCPGLETASQALLKHLALFFVPAGTGIVAYFALIQQEWLAITVALIGSTAVAIAVTALTMRTLIRRGKAASAIHKSPEADFPNKEEGQS